MRRRFLSWQPLTYEEHFTASNFKARDLAIAAYDLADLAIRTKFDNLTTAMTSILTAVASAMQQVRQDKTRAALATQATGWVKPLSSRGPAASSTDMVAKRTSILL